MQLRRELFGRGRQSSRGELAARKSVVSMGRCRKEVASAEASCATCDRRLQFGRSGMAAAARSPFELLHHDRLRPAACEGARGAWLRVCSAHCLFGRSPGLEAPLRQRLVRRQSARHFLCRPQSLPPHERRGAGEVGVVAETRRRASQSLSWRAPKTRGISVCQGNHHRGFACFRRVWLCFCQAESAPPPCSRSSLAAFTCRMSSSVSLSAVSAGCFRVSQRSGEVCSNQRVSAVCEMQSVNWSRNRTSPASLSTAEKLSVMRMAGACWLHFPGSSGSDSATSIVGVSSALRLL